MAYSYVTSCSPNVNGQHNSKRSVCKHTVRYHLFDLKSTETRFALTIEWSSVQFTSCVTHYYNCYCYKVEPFSSRNTDVNSNELTRVIFTWLTSLFLGVKRKFCSEILGNEHLLRFHNKLIIKTFLLRNWVSIFTTEVQEVKCLKVNFQFDQWEF